MPDTVESQSPQSINAAVCVDGHALDRLGRVLRHLGVGLVDEAINVRLVSADPRLETLKLGPIQTLSHERMARRPSGRKLDRLIGQLTQQPPTTVHAIGAGSFPVGSAIAEAFDADLLLQVISLADCDAIAETGAGRVRAILALTEPLVSALETQLKIAPELVHLVRPGLLASQQVTSFSDPERIPTILSTSAFEKGSGVEHVIEAVELLHNRGHSLMAFLLGSGRNESALRRLVRTRQLSASITFADPIGDLTEAMRSADIFVRPSQDTEFDVDPLQAMGVGMTVVTFPSPICDYIRNDDTAVVCPHPTGASLAEGIAKLLNDRSFAQRIAATAVEYVRANHAMSGMAVRTATVYKELALSRSTFSLRQ